jgi:hypothetical protein
MAQTGATDEDDIVNGLLVDLGVAEDLLLARRRRRPSFRDRRGRDLEPQI